jgi:hypothetical protein
MLEFIDSAEDVIVVKVAERITGADLTAIMDRLEQSMASHDKVHVYVETQSIDGIEVSGLGSHMARSTPLLGKLRQFGRVAVVADQAWVRIATRIESALLPFVSYRTFEPEQRAQALAWVRGSAS